MTGITREKASQVAASFLGGQSRYLGTYYKTYAATDTQGREWKFTFDGSILAEKKEHGEHVSTDATYKTEMVSPICTYEDIPTIQELVRQLRHKGGLFQQQLRHPYPCGGGGFQCQDPAQLGKHLLQQGRFTIFRSAGAGVPLGLL